MSGRQGIKRTAAWIARYELLFLALAAPFLLFPNRWTPLAFLLIPLVWAARWVATGRLTAPTLMDPGMALLVLMALVGFWVSVDPDMSRAKLWGILFQVAVFYAVANAVRTEGQALGMAGGLVGLTLGVALLSLVGTDWDAVRLMDLPGLYERLPRLVQGLPGSGVPRPSELFYPREVGATLALLLPLPVAFLLFGRAGWLRLLSGLAVVAGGAVLLLSQSVQAFVGLGLGLLLVAVWRSRWFLLALPLGLLALAGGLLAYGPQRAVLALLDLEHLVGIGVVLRWDIMNQALAMVGDMPYTGAGLNTYPLIQPHFYIGLLLGPEVHAHNQFLQAAVDLGLPGLLAFLWLLVAFYVTVVRVHRLASGRDLQVLLAGLAGGILAFVVHGLVDAVTLGAKPVAALFAMMGLAAALQIVEERRTTLISPTPSLRVAGSARWWVLAGVLLVALLLGVAVFAPGSWDQNLGAVGAHKALVAARSTGVQRVAQLQAPLGPLRRALAGDPGDADIYGRLGELYAWLGDYPAALEALERRVELDGRDPVGRYAPFETARRRVSGEGGHDGWDDLLWVYRHWRNRYPDRAEGYVRSAIVWHRYKGDPVKAAAVVQTGLKQGAQPRGLLAYYLAQIEGGEP